MATTFEFKLPDIGEGIHEGEIVKWHIQAGDTVEEDQIILEVQNDKAVVEIPSPVNGKVKEVKVREGTVSVVGDVLVTFEVEGDVAQPVEEGSSSATEECAAGGGVADNVAAASIDSPMTATKQGTEVEPSEGKKVLATPSVRKFARESGVNISQVSGTGRNSRITRKDIELFASGTSATIT